MNIEQKSIVQRAAVKIGIAICLIPILLYIGIGDMLKQSAQNEQSITAIATQQLLDNGQAYQEMKVQKVDSEVLWSSLTWIMIFSVCLALLWIFYVLIISYIEFVTKKE